MTLSQSFHSFCRFRPRPHLGYAPGPRWGTSSPVFGGELCQGPYGDRRPCPEMDHKIGRYG